MFISSLTRALLRAGRTCRASCSGTTDSSVLSSPEGWWHRLVLDIRLKAFLDLKNLLGSLIAHCVLQIIHCTLSVLYSRALGLTEDFWHQKYENKKEGVQNYLIISKIIHSVETSKYSIVRLTGICGVLFVQEVVTQPKILNRTILSNTIHVT